MNQNVGVVGDAMTSSTQPATQGLPDLLMPPPPAGPDLGGSVVQDTPIGSSPTEENTVNGDDRNNDRQGRRGGRGGRRGGSRGGRGGRRGGRGGRGGRGSHDNSDREKMDFPADPTGRRHLTVASHSPVKQVAGSIAHTTRDSEPPVLSAVGPLSVNQATKAVAVARSYLDGDGMQLYVEAERPGYSNHTNTIKDLVWLALHNKTHERAVPESDLTGLTELRSAGSTGTALLAGAVAKSVRELKRVTITAIGSDSVFRAVDAVSLASQYLKENNMGVRFQPGFKTVTFADGNTGNAMQLNLFPHHLEEGGTIASPMETDTSSSPVLSNAQVEDAGMAAVATSEVNRMLNVDQQL